MIPTLLQFLILNKMFLFLVGGSNRAASNSYVVFQFMIFQGGLLASSHLVRNAENWQVSNWQIATDILIVVTPNLRNKYIIFIS